MEQIGGGGRSGDGSGGLDASNLRGNEIEGKRKEKKRKDTDLDHDGQNGSQEGTEEETVCGENQGGESTDLFETADV